jgi:protein-disulfide isomerase
MPEEHQSHSTKKFKVPSFELTPSISILIAGVIIAGAIIFTNHQNANVAANAQGGTIASANVPLPSSSDHIVGSVNAPIALVEYSDFQCPYCQLIYPSLKQIQQSSNGQISWVMREFPLYQIHPEAMPAANAAECIAEQLGNDGWWKFVDDDFANQANIGDAFFTAEAQKLGVDMTKYNNCVKNSTYLSKIEAQTTEAENNGGNGTPFTVVINTKTGKQYPIPGALPLAQLQQVVAEAQASK